MAKRGAKYSDKPRFTNISEMYFMDSSDRPNCANAEH